MARPDLKAWGAASTTLRFETSVPSAAVFYAGTVTPGAALAAIANQELADGWAQDVVTKASERRGSKRKIWVAPGGVAVGNSLPRAMVPGGLSWLRTFWQPKYMGGYLGTYQKRHYPWAYDVSQFEGTHIDRWLSNKLAFLNESDETVVKMAKELVGVDDLVHTEVIFYDLTVAADRDVVMLKADANRIADSLPEDVFAVRLWAGPKREVDSPSSPSYMGVHRFAEVRFTRPASMEGVKVLVYSRQGNNSTFWNTDDRLHLWYSLAHYVGDASWLEVLGQQQWFTDKCSFSFFDADKDFTGSTPQKASFQYDDVATVKVPHEIVAPVEAVFGQSLTRGAMLAAGLQCYNVFVIGSPEFVTLSEFRGDVTIADRTLKMAAGTELNLEWPLEMLSIFDPTMTDDKKALIAGKSAVSVMAAKAWEGPLQLTDLVAYQYAAQANLSLELELYSGPMEGKPGVTFGDAIVRANKHNGTLFNVLRGVTTEVTDRVEKVMLVGDSNGIVATVWRRNSSNVVYADSVSADDAVEAISEGAPVVINVSAVGDPYLLCFGLTLKQILAGSKSRELRASFDENKMFGYRYVSAKGLSRDKLTAFMLGQSVHDRMSMASFAVAAASMGTRARKAFF